MPMKPKEMVKLLQKNGFKIERVNGSHYFMVNAESGKSTTVPFHTKELKPTMQNLILKGTSKNPI